jgi:small subunit ribosomal protein S6
MSDLEKREYELVYIVQPEFTNDEVSALNERVTQFVQGQDGEVQETELWGKRQLAYPIQNHFEGYYVLHRLNMPGPLVGEVERILRFNENVLRYMCMRTDS